MELTESRLNESHALKCELACEVLRSSGRLRLQVTGRSMLPTILPGDVLVIDRATVDKVSKGDVVLFRRDRRFVVHRVVTKSAEHSDGAILTQGDAMPTPDMPVSDGALMGKVSFIIRNGRCIEPSRVLGIPERAVAAIVQRSAVAARVVVGIYGLRRASSHRISQHPTLQHPISQDRAVPCQS
jgi:signal peptidase I